MLSFLPTHQAEMVRFALSTGLRQSNVFGLEWSQIDMPRRVAWVHPDLRHTWASWHVQAGTPIHELQELGGWESVEMVRRYAHLAPEHLARAAARILPPTPFGTKVATADEARGASAR